MLNQLVLVGRITHDPEPTILEDGKKVLKFQIAVQRAFKNYLGEYDTDFFSITCWEGLATMVENYITKGVMIAVKGRIQSWKYQLDEKKHLNMIEVIAEKVTYLESSKERLEKRLQTE